ncbi:M48 family metallopeptidase [Pseudorhodoferax sp.]|uniref:M48 family metallopeptidase n=1 Tax=Pseudorhodoferax sp. TaxID=1993553 RepID=UPI002DD62D09|nr:M48 family metallopeptidase [Pseudorhodoferax sp.]
MHDATRRPPPARLAAFTLAVVATLLTACANVKTTDAGAIGLDRTQYFEEGAREAIVADAAKSYDKLLQAALKHGALNEDAEATQRIVRIANRLIPHVQNFRPEAQDWAWEVNLITIDVPNATCRAGGKITVYTGLLDQWQPTDDELAAVIGHEIGHALRDHTAEKYSTRKRNSNVTTGVTSLLSIGLAAFTGVNLSKTIGQAGQAGTEAFANLPNSRALEHESDRIGMELMARAGYDPRAAITLWTKVAARSKSGGGEESSFWSTHPSDSERIQDLTQVETKVRALYVAAAAGKAGQ